MIVKDEIGVMEPSVHGEGCHLAARQIIKTRNWFLYITGGKCPGCGITMEYQVTETEFPDPEPPKEITNANRPPRKKSVHKAPKAPRKADK